MIAPAVLADISVRAFAAKEIVEGWIHVVSGLEGTVRGDPDWPEGLAKALPVGDHRPAATAATEAVRQPTESRSSSAGSAASSFASEPTVHR